MHRLRIPEEDVTPEAPSRRAILMIGGAILIAAGTIVAEAFGVREKVMELMRPHASSAGKR